MFLHMQPDSLSSQKSLNQPKLCLVNKQRQTGCNLILKIEPGPQKENVFGMFFKILYVFLRSCVSICKHIFYSLVFNTLY